MANLLRVIAPTFAAIGAAVITLTGCTAADAPEESAAASPGFGHVHALDFDPKTGATYASTHNGIWVLPTSRMPRTYPGGSAGPGTATVIANRAQDTMGFTVARPGVLLGSGHPDPAEQPELTPPNIGLISSSDGAETWTTISLRGETDFHDIETVELPDGQLRVYGYDATEGALKVSDDTGKTWTSAANLQARDFASDPANPDRIYATTAEGLMVSEDQGRSFAVMSSAPPLFLLTVTDAGDIIGIDVNGTIQRFHGNTWTENGTTVGVPEAFAYVGGDAPWILIADERGVVASDDFGKTTVALTGKEQ